jgi:anti-sigma B factor antagonist
MGGGPAQRSGGAAAPSPFTLSVRSHDAATSVISVEGELDLSSAPELKWTLTDALEAGVTRLAVDLSQTSFMDSTGLGVLIGLRKRLPQGCELLIVCPPGVVRQVFEFSGTDGAFSMFDTQRDAIEHLQTRAPRAG